MKRITERLLCLLLPLFLLVSCTFLPGADIPSVRMTPLSPDGASPAALDTIPFSAWEEAEAIGRAFEVSGTTSSATATGLDLQMDWTFAKKSGEKNAALRLSLSLLYTDYVSIREGTAVTFTLNGQTEEIPLRALEDKQSGRLSLVIDRTLSFPFPESRGQTVTASASLGYAGTRNTVDFYGSPITVRLDTVDCTARIPITDEYAILPASARLDVQNVMQIPELPNGCEITSLTILLRHLGFQTDKLTMADTYLPKNEDTYTSDFYQTFAGNPRNQKRSFGCYSPVIVRSARDFLAANDPSGAYAPHDLTGCCPEELYRQISLGNPVVVWMTQYIDSTPRILKTWESAEGKPMNWKHPLHCVVLIGYDKTAGTVTICDPLVGIVSHPIEKFELRYLQLGSQAVTVTK